MSKNENLKPFAIDAGKASVALAVASLCAAGAQAATIGKTGGAIGKLSYEKASIAAAATGGATAASNLGTMLVTLGATYSANDVLVLDLASNVTLGSAVPTLTCTPAAGPDVAWNIFDQTANALKFRALAGVSSATTTFSSNCTLVGAQLLDSSLDTVGETVSIRASGYAANGLVFDTSGTSTAVSSVINSLSAAVSAKFDGVVDPARSNKSFKNSGSTLVDVISFVFSSTAVDNPINLGTGTSGTSSAALTLDVTGDFNFLVNTTETSANLFAGTNSAIITASGSTAAGLSAVYTGSSVTGLRLRIEAGSLDSGDGASIAIQTDGSANANALPTQTYSGTYTITGVAGGGISTARTGSLTPGAWTPGGTTVFVPYMPVGSGINQVLYIANNSTIAGTTTVTATSQAGKTCTTSAVTTTASSNTNLSDALAAAIATCQAAGSIATTDKLMLTVVSTTPLANTEVYSSFTVSNSSRVSIPNSSNGYKSPGGNIGVSNADNTL